MFLFMFLSQKHIIQIYKLSQIALSKIDTISILYLGKKIKSLLVNKIFYPTFH